MTQKIINILVGSVAVLTIASALFVLQTKKSSDQSINSQVNETIIASEQSNVLGENTSKSNLEAFLKSEEVLVGGKTEIAVMVKVSNNTDSILQFSSGIDLSVLDVNTKIIYPVISSVKTTLFGGPINPKQFAEGLVYFQIPTSQQTPQLELIYQPNNSTITQSVKL